MSEFPSKFQMAKNLTSEMLASSQNAIMGKPVLVSQKIASDRFSICLSCENLHEERCKLCGCFMEKKTKLALATCPESKW
jgi:hypothetical protein